MPADGWLRVLCTTVQIGQEWFDDFLYGVAWFAQSCCDGFNADRAAAIRLRHQRQIAPVERVKPFMIDFKPRQRGIGNSLIDILFS